jgi:hypothetical protein
VIEYGSHPHFGPLMGLPKIAGLFVGGCVEGGSALRFRNAAHAHNVTTDPHFGWVCVRSPRRVLKADGERPSRIIMREYAHLLAPNQRREVPGGGVTRTVRRVHRYFGFGWGLARRVGG